jgi:autotransporter-associated beta strand protein
VGAVVTCSGTQSSIVGQGPGADNVTVDVNDGATVSVTNTNAISLGNNATITLGSSGPPAGGSAANPPVLVETTTNNLAGNGNYGDGSNTIDIGSNSTIVINRNASVIATGTQGTSEAINPYGFGDTILNYGVIQGGPSTAIWFQNVGPAGSPVNVVDNYGTIIAGSGGQAIGASGNIGIDFINETGGAVIGNVQLSGGNDHVTLDPGSTITGNLNGGGGVNLLTLNASPGSSDTMSGQINNFETLDKTGAGTWTLSGPIGNNTAAGSSPLAVNVIGGTLILTGNNSAFNGSATINPGPTPATPGPDPTATLEGPAQSLPPAITDHGILLINQTTPGVYGGLVQGTGVLTKIGGGVLTLTGANTYSGGTFLDAGVVAVGADSALGAATGPLTFNGGVLRFDSSFDLSSSRAITLNAAGGGFAGGGAFDLDGHVSTLAQAIGGAGGLTVLDSSGAGGLLILTGANSYSGGTTIDGGVLQLGAGGASGSLVGNVVDNATLAFDRSDVVTFPGTISGSGGLRQIGPGGVILDAANPFSGPTTVAAGFLAVGDAFHPAASLSGGGGVTVDPGAILGGYGAVSGDVFNSGVVAAGNALAAFAGGPTGEFRIGGNLLNDGTLNLAGSAVGNTLEIAGNYISVGGAANLNTFLNSGGPLSNQITDRLLVDGNAAGQTTLRVNAVGPGAYTSADVVHASEGISLAQVGGSSSVSAFSLQGGYVTGGTPFQYRLNAFGPASAYGAASPAQNLVGNPAGYWDYRLQSVYVTPQGPVAPDPDPGPPRPNERLEVAPQVPAYLATPNALFNAGLLDLDSLHRRLGDIRDDQIAGVSQQYEFFMRGYGGSLTYATDRSFVDFGFNAIQDYAATQFGVNWIARDDAEGTLRLGAAAAFGRLWIEPRAVDGSVKLRTIPKIFSRP